MTNLKRGEELTLEITQAAWGGKGLAKHESGRVVFVPGALPGQTVTAKVTRVKKRHADAKLLRVEARADYEIETNFQETPGGPYLRVPYATQLEWKQTQVTELLRRVAGVDITPVLRAVVPSPQIHFARNKMEYSFGPNAAGGPALGSKVRGQFWCVEGLAKPSGMFDEQLETLLPGLLEQCLGVAPTVYDQRTHEGVWRQLVVRKSFAKDELLVCVVTSSQGGELALGPLVEWLQAELGPRLAGVLHQVSDDVSDSASKYTSRDTLWGRDTLVEAINGLEFQLSVDSFFQTNPLAAERLYEQVVRLAGIPAGGLGLDLCCGTGTIAQLLAAGQPDARVIGVEIVPSAVQDAEANAQRNGLTNVEFAVGDVRPWLKNFLDGGDDRPTVDVVTLDPPRSGVSPKVLRRLIEVAPPTLVYVSCNPGSLAADLQQLLESGYRLTDFVLVDQFPHTHHVECVARLELSP